VVALEDLGSLDTLPSRGDLDQNTVLADALLLVQLWAKEALVAGASNTEIMHKREYLTSMMRRAFSTEAFVLKEKLASTSVETLPGMMFRISLPNSTSRRSRAASTLESISPPLPLPYSTARSISLAYSGFLEAARMREGLVVASWGWYLAMAVVIW
jgi:hypothetical protein